MNDTTKKQISPEVAAEMLAALVAVHNSGWLQSVPCGPLAETVRKAIEHAGAVADL